MRIQRGQADAPSYVQNQGLQKQIDEQVWQIHQLSPRGNEIQANDTEANEAITSVAEGEDSTISGKFEGYPNAPVATSTNSGKVVNIRATLNTNSPA